MQAHPLVDLNKKLKVDNIRIIFIHKSIFIFIDFLLTEIFHVHIRPKSPQLPVAFRPGLCGTSVRARHDGGLQQRHNPVEDYFQVGASTKHIRLQNSPIILDGHENVGKPIRIEALYVGVLLPSLDPQLAHHCEVGKQLRVSPPEGALFLRLNRYQDAAGFEVAPLPVSQGPIRPPDETIFLRVAIGDIDIQIQFWVNEKIFSQDWLWCLASGGAFLG